MGGNVGDNDGTGRAPLMSLPVLLIPYLPFVSLRYPALYRA